MTVGPNSLLSDSELSLIIQRIHSEHPQLGQTMVWGRLRSMGFIVTRERVRHTIRTTDPLHTALCWNGELARRQPYIVAGPNSLWHIGKVHVYAS